MAKETTTKFGRDVIGGLTELRDALRSGERLRKQFTIRTVELDLEEIRPHEYTPDEIRSTREALGVSQAVFAQMLAVKKSTIESWEQGTREPSKMACRLLDTMNEYPEKWLEFLERSIKEEEVTT